MKDAKANKTFKGVYAALVTPMRENQEIDFDALGNIVDLLINEGVHGLIPLGSTGEYYALSDQERTDVLRCTLDAADRRVPVLAGTNAGSTRQVVEFSVQAEKAGADGLLIAPPYYSLPTLDELYEHFKQINDAIGIPIMLYNYPGRTGVDMTCDFIERLTALKQVRYVKESTGDITRISELLLRCGDRLGIFCGCDTVALESFALGAVGWVGGIVNVLPREHVELYQRCLVQDYDSARELYFRMLPALKAIECSGKYTQYVKAGCILKGIPAGPPRLPLMPANASEIEQLKTVLIR